MEIDKKWFEVYEQLYGKNFNRLLTIGNLEKGYVNHNIKNIEEVKELITDSTNTEYYISLYSYLTEENILRWDTDSLDKYEKFAEKTCLLFRFRQNTDIIQEEISSLTDIQKFMFIRRSINLGSNKEIIAQAKKAYNFFKQHFNIKGTLIFNGYNECLLYYPKKELPLTHPSLSYYNLLKLIQEKLELTTLIYENIEPYAQLIPLVGTQNKHSRLYIQFYYPDLDYEEIIKNSQDKFYNPEHAPNVEHSDKLHDFIIDIDKEIHAHEGNAKYNFDKIWDKI